jgi:beta-glucanase (GH16 family)
MTFKLLFGFLLALYCTAHHDAMAAWQLVWSDEFTGPAINTTVWKYEIGSIRNNELQAYTNRSENARIENGCLVIEARKESYNGSAYTSASLNTRGTQAWQYGRIEMRAKLVKGKGMWPAFWAMGNSGSWPACGEIDLMELIGGGPGYDNRIYATIHWDSSGHRQYGGSQTLMSGTFADSFHVIGVEWDSAAIRWQRDGVQFFSAPLTAAARSAFHQPFYLLVNLAVGGSWPGSPDTATVFPQQYQIDWIRVYQQDGTGMGSGGNIIKHREFDPDRLWQTSGRLGVRGGDDQPRVLTLADIGGNVRCLKSYYRAASVDVSALPAGLYLVWNGMENARKVLIAR